ncbi:MAG: UDP-N-acetylmuramate dehydrogenase [Bacteroidales bacterium]|nr:UDP-N-acetylmuramate dehydrogenase [Bacteroidales bacterium]
MEIKEHYNIQQLNTFGIKVDAKYFTEVASIQEMKEAVEYSERHKLPILILGDGSNLLFMQDYNGFVIKVNLKGISLLREDIKHVYVKAFAGENWDEFVNYCCESGYYGLENLSLIPGNVGASPIQNIGAYGVELKDHFYELEFYDFATGKIRNFNNSDCNFGYRNSIFKNEFKQKGVVLSVTFKFDKIPKFKTGYGVIKEELDRMEVINLTAKDIRNAVINIRRSKLPDPGEIGNAGSFFKNPVVTNKKYKKLLSQFPKLVSFKQHDGTYKLAAGWLIDQCGWKGYRKGNAGVHENQALVLVNYGNATGKDVYNLSEKVKTSVFEKFGVELEREVNVI